MSKAPVGAVVGITYDTEDWVMAGSWLVTKTGRTYRVIEACQVKGRARWKIRAVVEALPPPHGAHVLTLKFHARGTRKARAPRQTPTR